MKVHIDMSIPLEISTGRMLHVNASMGQALTGYEEEAVRVSMRGALTSSRAPPRLAPGKGHRAEGMRPASLHAGSSQICEQLGSDGLPARCAHRER